MRKLIDEKVNWSESQLMRKWIEVDWWEIQLMRKPIYERGDQWERWRFLIMIILQMDKWTDNANYKVAIATENTIKWK